MTEGGCGFYPKNATNIATTAVAIKKKVSQTKALESLLLLYSPIIFSFEAIFAIKKIRGTAMIPLITAVITRARTGSIPIKLIIKPIKVATVITP